MPSVKNKFTIICDSREKKGWTFDEDEYCKGSEILGLETGDYSIKGLEDILCIERKRNTAELATNVYEERFANELERMSKFKYRFLLMEFNYEDILYFPINSGLPPLQQKKSRVSPGYLKYFVGKMQIHYGVNVMFCGSPDNAKEAAYQIMKNVFFKETKNGN